MNPPNTMSVIPADNRITVDGESYLVDLDGCPVDGIHAIQWHNDVGTYEFTESGKPAETFDNFTEIRIFYNAWMEAKKDFAPQLKKHSDIVAAKAKKQEENNE